MRGWAKWLWQECVGKAICHSNSRARDDARAALLGIPDLTYLLLCRAVMLQGECLAFVLGGSKKMLRTKNLASLINAQTSKGVGKQSAGSIRGSANSVLATVSHGARPADMSMSLGFEL